MNGRPGALALLLRRLAKLHDDPAGFFLQSRFSMLRDAGRWHARRLDKRIVRAADAAADRAVAVIVTAFDAADTLEAALDSLARQSHRTLEVIVVDDASTDATQALARAFCERDPRFRLLINAENSGPYVSRNRALSQTRADFVTFQDADDLSHPDRIARQLGFLLANPARLACLCSGTRQDDAGRLLRIDGRRARLEASTFFFHRERVMASIGYFDCVRFAGDAEYASRLHAVHGARAIGRQHEVLLTARFAEGRSPATGRARMAGSRKPHRANGGGSKRPRARPIAPPMGAGTQLCGLARTPGWGFRNTTGRFPRPKAWRCR